MIDLSQYYVEFNHKRWFLVSVALFICGIGLGIAFPNLLPMMVKKVNIPLHLFWFAIEFRDKLHFQLLIKFLHKLFSKKIFMLRLLFSILSKSIRHPADKCGQSMRKYHFSWISKFICGISRTSKMSLKEVSKREYIR